jgi:hypothetical protein
VADSFPQRTSAEFTVAADNGHDVVGEAPIARQVLNLYGLSLLDGEHLGDLFKETQVTALASQAN